jgi:hypothetical protein
LPKNFNFMRYLLICCLAVAFVAGCKNDDAKGAAASGSAVDSSQFTTIQWIDSSSRDFGKIREGTKLAVEFRFRNTGDKPLVIENVRPSCGCTVAEQSKEPIPPGGEGTIRASFNSEGRTGVNHKTLYVTANTKGTQQHSLQFVVEVEKKP